jgi:hypothetical protein
MKIDLTTGRLWLYIEAQIDGSLTAVDGKHRLAKNSKEK